MKKALVTGITGQDGRHLTDYLLKQGYRVFGLTRNLNSPNTQNFLSLYPNVEIIPRPTNHVQLKNNILNRIRPEEIYNLSAFSSVAASFENPIETLYETGIFALELFEACRTSEISESVKIYQAGSSEMFGSPSISPQNEQTPFHPISPYGAAKAYAHNMGVQFRENYNLHISNGILFNHEGPNRPTNYVSKKIISNVVAIKQGRIKKFKLGNIEGRRDWGYAGDYVKAMNAMLIIEKADDFIISTGKSHSVKEFLKLALEIAGLHGEIEEYVDIDQSLQRPADNNFLVGDSSKARKLLGWTPETNFEELILLMFKHEMQSSF